MRKIGLIMSLCLGFSVLLTGCQKGVMHTGYYVGSTYFQGEMRETSPGNFTISGAATATHFDVLDDNTVKVAYRSPTGVVSHGQGTINSDGQITATISLSDGGVLTYNGAAMLNERTGEMELDGQVAHSNGSNGSFSGTKANPSDVRKKMTDP
jgi:hypothetical protein